jgi:hypothetical protein
MKQFEELKPRFFLLAPLEKVPLAGSHGVYDATENVPQLLEEANKHPGCNFGVATGHNGLIVVDADRKNGKDGVALFTEMMGGTLPRTSTIKTPNDGYHFYFYADKEYRSCDALKSKGLEIKGFGSHVVLGGSELKRDDGSIGYYEPINEEDIAPLPPCIVELLEANEAKGTAKAPFGSPTALDGADTKGLDALLSKIDPDLPYDDWRNVIWSAASEFGTSNEVRALCKNWSRKGKKWNGENFDKIFDGFDHSKKFNSLPYYAKQYPSTHFLPDVDSKDLPVIESIVREVTRSTVSTLVRDGNKITTDHKKDLETLAKVLAHSAFTASPKRLAVPLFTGGGKTQTVINHAAVISEEPYRKGLWIAVGTIAQIDEIAEALKEKGVPESYIGKRHSGKGSNVTSSNAGDYPILLVTHERIKMGDYEALMTYQGHPRQLIWDEALLSTRAEHMNINRLVEDIGAGCSVIDVADSEGKARPAELLTANYLRALLNTIKNVEGKDLIDLPEHPGELDLGRVRHLKSLQVLEDPTSTRAMVDKEKHVFWFVIQVPDEFQNIVILDASIRIKKLEQFDNSIEIVPMVSKKDYSPVTIHFCKHYQGKHTVNDPKKNVLLYQEIAEIIRGKERIVCFHLPEKDRVEYAPQRLRHFLGEADNVAFVSWGESKGVNHLRDIQYGTHVGMIYRDINELKASIAGQKRKERYEVSDKEQREVQLSEHAEAVFQAISRLACRKIEDGKALPTEFWLFYPSRKILRLLEEVMPGVTIREYVPKVLAASRGSRKLSAKILDFVSGNRIEKVTLDSLRENEELGIGSIKTNSKIWRGMRKELEAMASERGYVFEGRTLKKAA